LTIIDSQIRNIKCDAPGCKNEIIYDRKDEKTTVDNPDNAWLKSLRMVQTIDGRGYSYCSDACELEGVKTGKHNLPELPKVATATQQDLSKAVALAQARAAAEAQLRAGETKIQVTD
jgi:hypothetical protein